MKDKRKRTITYLIMLLEIAEIAGVIRCLYEVGPDSVPPLWIFSVSANIISMGIGFVLLFSSSFNRHFAKIGYFNALLITVTITSGIDALSWIIDGAAKYDYLQNSVNTLLYVATSTISLLFYLFIIRTITGRALELKLLTGVLIVLYAVEIFLVVLNIWKGFFFYIDDTFTYHRGSFYFLSFLYPVGTEWIATSIIMKHRMPSNFKTILILCCLMPTIASAISAAFYGIGIIYISVQMMLVIVYSIFFAEMDFNSARLRARYGNQVSNQTVNKLVDSKTGTILPTRRRNVSVLYCHIRNFSEVSRNMQPGDKTALMSACYTKLVRMAEKRDGVLLEFLNDSLFFVFGAPTPSEKHAEKAVAAALEMQREFILAAERGNTQFKGAQLSISIHTDDILVGSVGNEQQLQYTTISDDLNFCRGIDEHAKCGDVLISPDTVRAVHVPLGYGPKKNYNTDRCYFGISACSVLGIEGPYKIRMPSVMK